MQSFIETAISVILLFLLVSIVVTAINEIIARLLRLRGRVLFGALQSILKDDGLRDNFYKAGFIFQADSLSDNRIVRGLTMMDKKKAHPSYISSTNFAKSLIFGAIENYKNPPGADKDGASNAGADNPPLAEGNSATDIIANLKTIAEKSENPFVKNVLLDAVAGAGDAQADLEKVEASIAAWFDTAMDRIAGQYKRRQQRITFWLGLVIAIGFNINTLDFVTAVRLDDDLRVALVEQASEITKDNEIIQTCVTPLTEAEAAAQTPEEKQAATVKELECYQSQLSGAFGQLEALPIGWKAGEARSVETAWRNLGSSATFTSGIAQFFGILVGGIAGWLITAFAVTLGAPFWFDLLKTFVNIRTAGVRPKEAAKPGAATTS